MPKPTNREDAVIEAVTRGGNKNSLITLSTGIVLSTKRVPNLLFSEVVRKFKPPSVPVMFNEEMGREIENPDDPRYQELMGQYNNNISMAIVDLMILAGTDIYAVPSGMSEPDDEGWLEELSAILDIVSDVPVKEFNKRKRYLMWVKYYAAPQTEDIEKLMAGVGRASGVAEEDVSDAVGRFRNRS